MESTGVVNMNFNEVDRIVKKSLDLFYMLDSNLLDYKIGELSLSHKYAECLQVFFSEFDVDIEYNKLIDVEIKDKELKNVNNYIDHWFSRKENIEYLKEIMNKNTVDICSIKDNLKRDFEEDNIDNKLGKFIDKRKVRPDIIVHKRGPHVNFLIIEIKKSNNFKIENVVYDMIKLEMYQQQLNYQYCLFLQFNVEQNNRICMLYWYKPNKYNEFQWVGKKDYRFKYEFNNNKRLKIKNKYFKLIGKAIAEMDFKIL